MILFRRTTFLVFVLLPISEIACIDCGGKDKDMTSVRRFSLPNKSIFARIAGLELAEIYSMHNLNNHEECSQICDRDRHCSAFEFDLPNRLCVLATEYKQVSDNLAEGAFDRLFFVKVRGPTPKFLPKKGEACLDKSTHADYLQKEAVKWLNPQKTAIGTISTATSEMGAATLQESATSREPAALHSTAVPTSQEQQSTTVAGATTTTTVPTTTTTTSSSTTAAVTPVSSTASSESSSVGSTATGSTEDGDGEETTEPGSTLVQSTAESKETTPQGENSPTSSQATSSTSTLTSSSTTTEKIDESSTTVQEGGQGPGADVSVYKGRVKSAKYDTYLRTTDVGGVEHSEGSGQEWDIKKRSGDKVILVAGGGYLREQENGALDLSPNLHDAAEWTMTNVGQGSWTFWSSKGGYLSARKNSVMKTWALAIPMQSETFLFKM